MRTRSERRHHTQRIRNNLRKNLTRWSSETDEEFKERVARLTTHRPVMWQSAEKRIDRLWDGPKISHKKMIQKTKEEIKRYATRPFREDD